MAWVEEPGDLVLEENKLNDREALEIRAQPLLK